MIVKSYDICLSEWFFTTKGLSLLAINYDMEANNLTGLFNKYVGKRELENMKELRYSKGKRIN